ncbi:MAG: zinc ABC transporter substrate-binding protein [Planctomycetota bacterium]
MLIYSIRHGLHHAFLGVLAGVLLLPVLSGCERSDVAGSAAPVESGSGPLWIATTGHIGDALDSITAGTDITVVRLCGPGVDPHSFSASVSDVQKMESSQAIFYNGFHLEALLHEVLEGRYDEKSYAMASGFPDDARIDWVEDGEVNPEVPYDPHIWNHLPGWSQCVEGLIDRCVEISPANESQFRKNGGEYIQAIRDAHAAAEATFAKIPKEQRVLVSAHDAFNYFAEVYGFESVAVLGIGNDAEADVKTVREVSQKIVDRKVPVIFLESITNPKVTSALREACQARGWDVKVADTPLYSDDLGAEPPVDTYLGAFQSNVDLISGSLGGSASSDSGASESGASESGAAAVGASAEDA